jgi:hypothetical protein
MATGWLTRLEPSAQVMLLQLPRIPALWGTHLVRMPAFALSIAKSRWGRLATEAPPVRAQGAMELKTTLSSNRQF